MLNDADFFDGWWYMRSGFCPKNAHGTDSNEQKFIRFQTWGDFRTGRWEDLSALLPDKTVPCYLMPTPHLLSLAALLHEDPTHPRGGCWLRKK